MTDLMRPVPFKELLSRILSEYKATKTIFSFSPSLSGPQFDKSPLKNHDPMVLFDEVATSPIGPAAGPHTQLAQNIVSSWLSGARFFELKTVQIMDTLEIEKPCIDAEDEGFNTEWSTEYTLDKAYDEYLKAWFLCHLMQALFEDKNKSFEKEFIFNMSVGYNLEGIQNPRMDEFITRLQDSSQESRFKTYASELKEFVLSSDLLNQADFAEKREKIAALCDSVTPHICGSMTLSTMHGCPPEEIEKIAVYFLTEKKIHTFVKLNPTLLTFEGVRGTLDRLGFDYVGLKRESFDHDLQYPDAVAMLTRLRALAKEQNLRFGVKLTNTLGSVNNKNKLPGDEMYMSGRALFPISTQVALKLSKEFKGDLPISFSGGATAANVEALLNCGIHPITMATDMLKPGGYARLSRAVEASAKASNWNKESIDIVALEELVDLAFESPEYKKEKRGSDVISTGEPLPLFDCAVAPCKAACAIHQDIPEYIKLVGEGQYKEALQVIYNKNPLPFITGWICDHKCQYNCTRMDYEGSVRIRDMKKIAAQKGWDEYIKEFSTPKTDTGVKVAVVGAGPAGLAAAYHLRRGGYSVSIFEKESSAGGVISHVLPAFRIPVEAIQNDMDFIKMHGVDFHFNQENLSIENLKSKGFDKVILAVGAEKNNKLALEGEVSSKVMTSLNFLHQFKHNPESLNIGSSVAIVGAGNTAMDSARSAKRLSGVKEVHVIYRRTLKEMPADREEYYDALEEGIHFHFLRNPAAFKTSGKLSCTIMELGEADESGRRRPIATDKEEVLEIDTLITAIGESVDTEALNAMGLKVEGKWAQVEKESNETSLKGVYLVGDAQTGPQSIVSAMGSARKAVEAILKEKGLSIPDISKTSLTLAEKESLIKSKGESVYSASQATLSDELKQWAKQEASRCLQCNSICNKCVEVCPNRANVIIKTDREIFGQETQILHLDAFCNECGNCAQFCPWEKGQPYKGKLTIFSREDDFKSSTNSGFFLPEGLKINAPLKLRVEGVETELSWDGQEIIGAEQQENEQWQKAISMTRTVLRDYPFYAGKVGE